jgi:hypothetical protein
VNISKAKFDEMTSAVEVAQRELALERGRRAKLAEDAQAFDKILDKIVDAAHGVPLHEGTRYGMTPGYAVDGHRCQPPTTEEIHRGEIADLNSRIVYLESRLAATVAVAQFAHEHK